MNSIGYRMVCSGVVELTGLFTHRAAQYDRKALLAAIKNCKKNRAFATESERQAALAALTGALTFMDKQRNK